MNLNEVTRMSADKLNQIIDVFDPEKQTLIKTNVDTFKRSFYQPPQECPINVVYKVIYPSDFNIKSVPAIEKSKVQPKALHRTGRLKKVASFQKPQQESQLACQETKVKTVSVTRSGRVVKVPKHIQNDFKKIITNDHSGSDANNSDVKISDFEACEENKKDNVKSRLNEETMPSLTFLPKKRRIAAQYRCPQCNKAYLGRSKILEHLRKNPTHGPMPPNSENHFQIWNYLVSITQKCPSSERGMKFCQELSNLLHSLLLLTNALFKTDGPEASEVKIDKVLGNAIGLNPGTYYFDDSNLYKDVIVLQLMGNTDFSNSVKSQTLDHRVEGISENKYVCEKLNSDKQQKIIQSDTEDLFSQKVEHIKTEKQLKLCNSDMELLGKIDHNKHIANDTDFLIPANGNMSNFLPMHNFDMEPDHFEMKNEKVDNKNGGVLNEPNNSNERKVLPMNCKIEAYIKNELNSKSFSESSVHNINYEFSVNSCNSNKELLSKQENETKCPKIKIQSNILLRPPSSKFHHLNSLFTTKLHNESHIIRNKSSLHSELMTDSYLPHPDDELMLAEPSETDNILDNSASSDEVMNVDQFVNERFRRLTESDLEMGSSCSLNIDMPALDLFQFHTT